MKISNKRTKNFTKSKKYLSLIENSSVYDVANVSPITNATNLSNKLGHNVFLKREDLQPIFSFPFLASMSNTNKHDHLLRLL